MCNSGLIQQITVIYIMSFGHEHPNKRLPLSKKGWGNMLGYLSPDINFGITVHIIIRKLPGEERGIEKHS